MSFCVFLPPHLHLLSPYHFCPLLSHLCMKCSLGISDFLEEISSLSHSVVFLYFFSLIAEEGFLISSCYSLAQSCLTLCDPLDCSMPGLPVPHHNLEFAQVLVHCIGDAVQPSHPLMPSSPSALSFSQH